MIIRVNHAKGPFEDVPIIMIAGRNITYEDIKYVSGIIRNVKVSLCIVLKYTKELESEIKNTIQKILKKKDFDNKRACHMAGSFFAKIPFK